MGETKIRHSAYIRAVLSYPEKQIDREILKHNLYRKFIIRIY